MDHSIKQTAEALPHYGGSDTDGTIEPESGIAPQHPPSPNVPHNDDVIDLTSDAPQPPPSYPAQFGIPQNFGQLIQQQPTPVYSQSYMPVATQVLDFSHAQSGHQAPPATSQRPPGIQGVHPPRPRSIHDFTPQQIQWIIEQQKLQQQRQRQLNDLSARTPGVRTNGPLPKDIHHTNGIPIPAPPSVASVDPRAQLQPHGITRAIHHGNATFKSGFPGETSGTIYQPTTNVVEALQTVLAGLETAGSHKDELPPKFLEKFQGRMTTHLLRHQRRALMWMIRKETGRSATKGGILADDQGLGKTVSTIALIMCQPRAEEERIEVAEEREDDGKEKESDADGDGDGNREENDAIGDGDAAKKKESIDNDLILIEVSTKEVEQQLTKEAAKKAKEEKYLKSKGLLAGTLVVCPSTVLYQWEEEIRSKTPRRLTDFGDNRVYVYHGKSKGITPQTLARFQVVLTTYGTMTQELPEFKRPVEKQMYGGNEPIDLVEEDEDGASGKGKKRKRTVSGGPLYQVKWHRVVLDEAQVIKNHRTVAAHAAWALNADRRWCLSGTPIQNSVDDLYSYFKFLQYSPYNKYSTFKELIKDPISRDDSRIGFPRLRVILQNILLRRTKTTKIDGDPIISLPERRVNLVKIDFSKEERKFYDRVEKEAMSKMKAIQSEGTVGQNYISMLYMLLRLRQACNHPLLVRGASSAFAPGRQLSKVELMAEKAAAKKLSPALRASLSATLKDSMSECVACNDVPEDPMVSICGHTFCRQCVTAAISSAGQGMGEEELAFLCPRCREALHKNKIFSSDALDDGGRSTPVTNANALQEIEIDYDDDSDVAVEDESSNDEKKNARRGSPPGHSRSSSKIEALMKILKELRDGSDPDKNNSPSGEDSNGTSATKTEGKPVVRNVSMAKLHEAITRGSGSSSFGKSSSPFGTNHSSGHMDQRSHRLPHMEKVIVFSQWTSMLDLIETALTRENFLFRRLDGTQSLNARRTSIKDFTRLPEVSVMLVSLKAASLGVNLVSANHVVLMDLWYNPSTEDQAIDRAHRIGQTKPVNVTRITIKDTVEDNILQLQEKKQKMVSSAFGENGAGAGLGMRLTMDEIMNLFGFASKS